MARSAGGDHPAGRPVAADGRPLAAQPFDRLRTGIAHIAEGQVSEWGGAVILDEQDNLKLESIVEGTAHYLRIRRPEREFFVGSFHTHPRADGITGIPFSAVDIVDMINAGEQLSIVQSGADVFMMLPTEMTPARMDAAELYPAYASLHNHYLGENHTEADAAYYANVDLCIVYHLVFYLGSAFRPLEEVYRP